MSVRTALENTPNKTPVSPYGKPFAAGDSSSPEAERFLAPCESFPDSDSPSLPADAAMIGCLFWTSLLTILAKRLQSTHWF